MKHLTFKLNYITHIASACPNQNWVTPCSEGRKAPGEQQVKTTNKPGLRGIVDFSQFSHSLTRGKFSVGQKTQYSS